MTHFNLGIAQLNPTVGDFKGNCEKILFAWERLDKEAHLILLPAFALTGYPLESLLLRRDFLKDCENYLKEILSASESFNSALLLSIPLYREDISQAYLLLYQGKVIASFYKRLFPKKVFQEEEGLFIFEIEGVRFGVNLCENFSNLFSAEKEALAKPHVIINLHPLPYYLGKYTFIESLLKNQARENQCYIALVNFIGGQDEYVFDGRSLVLSPQGEVLARAKAFEEDLLVVSINPERANFRNPSETPSISLSLKKEVPFIKGRIERNPEEEEEVFSALKLSLKDYFYKNGFQGVIFGLSGGIDSALVAVLSVYALGREKVKALFMPSEFTSRSSFEDAEALAKNLGIPFLHFPIQEIFKLYREEIKKYLNYADFTVAEENLQARIRANLLFYLSNREGFLVLATSNKSEAATGYGTIYGDIAGGFAPLKDVYKTMVYRLARYLNSIEPFIPERIFIKAPSAELRPDQKDEDTLPPYKILDEILWLHLEEGLTPEEIVVRGYSPETVKKVLLMLKKAEYKRRQAPLGPKITKRALGLDFRLPITNQYL